jgi:hypothetical protein
MHGVDNPRCNQIGGSPKAGIRASTSRFGNRWARSCVHLCLAERRISKICPGRHDHIRFKHYILHPISSADRRICVVSWDDALVSHHQGGGCGLDARANVPQAQTPKVRHPNPGENNSGVSYPRRPVLHAPSEVPRKVGSAKAHIASTSHELLVRSTIQITERHHAYLTSGNLQDAITKLESLGNETCNEYSRSEAYGT